MKIAIHGKMCYGKTTLAKNGIAECLKNSNNNGFIGHIHVRPNQFSLSLNYLLRFNKKNEDYLMD